MIRVTTGENIVVNDTTSNDTTGTTSLFEKNLPIQLTLYPNPIHSGQDILFKTKAHIQSVKMISITVKKWEFVFHKTKFW